MTKEPHHKYILEVGVPSGDCLQNEQDLPSNSSHFDAWRKIADSPNSYGVVVVGDVNFVRCPNAFLDAAAQIPLALQGVLVRLDCETRHGKLVGRMGDVDVVTPRHRLSSFACGYLIGRVAAQRVLRKFPPTDRSSGVDLSHDWKYDVPVFTTSKRIIERCPQQKIDQYNQEPAPNRDLKSIAKLFLHQGFNGYNELTRAFRYRKYREVNYLKERLERA